MDDLIENILAEYLDSLQDPQVRANERSSDLPTADKETQSYLNLVKEISRVSQITPSREFTFGASDRLTRKLKSRKIRKHKSSWWSAFFTPLTLQVSRSPVLIAAIALVLLVFVSTGTAYASTNTIPGDFLYPVKLGIESAQLSLSSNADGVQLDLKFASTRLEEASKLVALGKYNLVAETVLASQSKIADAQAKSSHLYTGQGDQAKLLMQEVSNQEDHNQVVLAQILEKVPAAARDGILNAIENSGKKPGQHKDDNQPNNSVITETPVTAPLDAPGLLKNTETPPGSENNHGSISPNDNQNQPGVSPGQLRKSQAAVNPTDIQTTDGPPPGSLNVPAPQKTKSP